MSTANRHVQDAQDGVEDAAASPAVKTMGRLGFAALGLLYITVGLIAGSVGVGTSEDADSTGAINQLSQNSFGTIILVVLTVGLASYAVLRLIHVVVNPSGEDGAKGAAKRIGYLVQAVVYGSLTIYTIGLLTGGGGGGGGGDSEQSATARALELPFGAWLVGGVALILVAVAITQLKRAITQDFMDQAATGGRARALMRWTGTIGHAARAVLFGTIAWLFAQAALRSDSSEAGGTDAAIQELATSAGGTILLLTVALGVVCYGVWCLTMARWGDPRHAE